MASKPKTKDLNLGRASREFLAQKSETEIARMLRLRGRIVPRLKKSGRRLSASWLWQKWEIGLMGKHPDKETARRIGRSVAGVLEKRKGLHIPVFNGLKDWRAWELKLMGKIPDGEVARRTGRTCVCVSSMRHYLRIKGFGAPYGRPKWPQKEIDLLGKVSDDEVARRTGRKRSAVYVMRRKLGMPSVKRNSY
jgi:hypothetical protein